MTFNSTFHITINGKVYYRQCEYKGREAEITPYSLANTDVIIRFRDDDEEVIVPIKDVELLECKKINAA